MSQIIKAKSLIMNRWVSACLNHSYLKGFLFSSTTVQNQQNRKLADYDYCTLWDMLGTDKENTIPKEDMRLSSQSSLTYRGDK